MAWQHGSSGYSNHGCRCQVCTEGHRLMYGIRQRERSRRLGYCTVAGCEDFQYARGMCRAHYERARTGQAVDVQIHRKPNARIFDPWPA